MLAKANERRRSQHINNRPKALCDSNCGKPTAAQARRQENKGACAAATSPATANEGEPQASRRRCDRQVFSRLFGPPALAGFLGVCLTLAAFSATAQPGSVTLAWNPSPDPTVVGYNVYYGGASGAYTNEFSAGNAATTTISGLSPGLTYYFAATAYSASGLESPFSSELSYTVPLPPAGVQIGSPSAGQFVLTVTGTAGHTYSILATQDFQTWTVIGTVKMGASGSLQFTDINAASYPWRFYRALGS
jgi:hypothetical protein